MLRLPPLDATPEITLAPLPSPAATLPAPPDGIPTAPDALKHTLYYEALLKGWDGMYALNHAKITLDDVHRWRQDKDSASMEATCRTLGQRQGGPELAKLLYRAYTPLAALEAVRIMTSGLHDRDRLAASNSVSDRGGSGPQRQDVHDTLDIRARIVHETRQAWSDYETRRRVGSTDVDKPQVTESQRPTKPQQE